jgi:hypothetical protein
MGRTPEVSDYVAMTISSFIANLAVGGLLVLRKANLREIAFPGVFPPFRCADFLRRCTIG